MSKQAKRKATPEEKMRHRAWLAERRAHARAQAADVKGLLLKGYSVEAIAQSVGRSQAVVSWIAQGAIWRGVKPNLDARVVGEGR
jgi:hypothetical protein